MRIQNLFVLAAVGAFGGSSFAQSGVTVSGGIDLSMRLEHTAAGASDWQMVSGGGPRSNITFSGAHISRATFEESEQ